MAQKDKATLIARDQCEGAAEIGVVIEKDERAALHLCYTRQIPAYKQGGKWHMRPSRYFQYVRDQEDAALAARTNSAAQTP
jgi:hypothetical protein